MKGWGDSASAVCVGKILETIQITTLVLFTLCTGCILSCLVCIVVILCVHVYLCYVCTAVFTLDAGLLAKSQYSEGPVTGHLDTGFSWFPCVYKQMLRWFPRFQVATTYLNLVVTNFMFCLHVK